MLKKHGTFILLIAMLISLVGIPTGASESSTDSPPSDTPKISLSDEMGEAMIREASRVPVGVSYDADPKEVEKILLDIAEKEPMIERHEKPAVRFIEFGDSSLNFELLVWIDVQKTARKKIRSRLNFAIFEALQNAGIEIPFPQRDIHIRTQ